VTTAVVNGVSLNYDERGAGSAVLFIHGTGASSFAWDRSIATLPPGRRLINYDRRGFGKSREVEARRLGDHVRDAAALLRQLEAGPAAVVTQSGGAPIALRLTIEYPELVSALVMAEPAYQVALHPSVSVSRAMVKLLSRWLVRRDPEGAALGYYRWATRFTTGGNAYDGYPQDWQSTARGHAHATLREVLQLIVPRPRARAVRGISCPVTLVIGDIGEPVFRRTTRRVHRLVPGARMVTVSPTSHLIPVDQPRLFADAVAEALGMRNC
jgi:pimeloyl-ACP methyl ester carboxylesterase